MLGRQRHSGTRSLPNTSTYDQQWVLNPRPFDHESKTVSTGPHAPTIKWESEGRVDSWSSRHMRLFYRSDLWPSVSCFLAITHPEPFSLFHSYLNHFHITWPSQQKRAPNKALPWQMCARPVRLDTQCFKSGRKLCERYEYLPPICFREEHVLAGRQWTHEFDHWTDSFMAVLLKVSMYINRCMIVSAHWNISISICFLTDMPSRVIKWVC